jgi:hypothetical protein
LSFYRFLPEYLLYTAMIALLAWLADYLNPTVHILIPGFWHIFLFTALITLVTYLIAWLGIRKGGDTSMYGIMGSITLKLFIYLGFILIYIYKVGVTNRGLFMLDFFSLYLFFTVFEIYSLLRNLRNQNSK